MDQQVQADLDAFGQNFANTYGSCKLLYYNAALSEDFTKEACDLGYKGTTITYTVAADKYTSVISQADADEQAQEEMDANAQSYANLPGNAGCVIDTEPDFIGDETAPTQCQVVNGANTGHQLILVTDVNPNSATYNQTQWADMGENTSVCPIPPCTNCSGTGYKCVNGHCEFGAKIYTNSACVPGGRQPMTTQNPKSNTSNNVHPNYSGTCHLTYHYEWSDGSWSQNYTESGGGCSVGGSGCVIINQL